MTNTTNAFTNTTINTSPSWGWKDEEISIYFVIFLSILALVLILSKWLRTKPRISSIFPEAGMVLIVGIILGFFLHIFTDNNNASSSNANDNDNDNNNNNNNAPIKEVLSFDPTIFFLVFLPPIIFNSGYNIQRELLIRNIQPILLFSCIGTTLSAIFIAISLHIVCNSNLVGSNSFDKKPTLVELFAFGSLISATDPVSTLAVFETKKVDPQLFMLVFGESVLNDAVSIVLFNSFSKFVGKEDTFGKVAMAILMFVADFLFIFIGSFVLGMVSGIITGLLFKYVDMRPFPTLELSLYVLVMYVPFFVADIVGLSGIVTILFTGISSKSYAVPNVSSKTEGDADTLFRVTSHLAETCIFLEMGLSFFGLTTSGTGADYWKFIMWALLFCLLGRAIFIYPLSWFYNTSIWCIQFTSRTSTLQSSPSSQLHQTSAFISQRIQHMLWFSGLRGAVAYACAKSFPNYFGNRDVFVLTTIVIIFITVFVFGSTTTLVLKLLRIDMNVDEVSYFAMHDELFGMFHKFEKKYILPYVLRDDDNTIDECFDNTDLEFDIHLPLSPNRGNRGVTRNIDTSFEDNKRNTADQQELAICDSEYIDVDLMKVELELRQVAKYQSPSKKSPSPRKKNQRLYDYGK